MDDTANQIVSPAAASPTPAFSGPRWNGWVLLLIGLAGILAFIVTQTIAFAIIFFRAHPDALKAGMPAGALGQDAMIDLLSAKNLWYISVSSEIVLALVTLVLARVALGATARTLGLGKFPAIQWIFFGILAGAALVFASGFVEKLQNLMFGTQPPQFQALVLLKHHGAWQFCLDFMSVSIAAPFAEETFFRGLIFTGLAQRIPVVYAAIISAAVFGLAHFEKFSVLPIFVIGLGLAYVYYTTRSLWASMTAHATVNAISLIIAYAFPQLVK